MNYQAFWELDRYAVVGHSSKRRFPLLTYTGLKQRGKTVFPVDPEADQIDGDPACRDLASLPERVDGVVIETPPEESAGWVRQAADAGISRVWIHQRCDTAEARTLAREKGLELWTGTCAVMYLRRGFHIHGFHRLINRT
ncbi:MAG: CoA-binding protein, partial [Candidatus Neomarinimicrobiota bacterium]